MKTTFMGCALVLLGVAACGDRGATVYDFPAGPSTALGARAMTLVTEGCTLDTWQTAALADPSVRRLVHEVILLCATARANGDVTPADPDARAALGRTVAVLRSDGYKARIGVTMGDDLQSFPVPYSDARASAALADPKWHAAVVTNLAPLAALADGLEIDFLHLPAASRDQVTQLFVELDAKYHPASWVGVMAPPSTTAPSDTPGGDAFDLDSIAPKVDRVRMMTLDFSIAGPPGPDIDAGWGVDVARFAMQHVRVTPVDLAVPLYGTDFAGGQTRFVSYEEARGISAATGAPLARGTGGEAHFDWVDVAGVAHHTWTMDSQAVTTTLAAWGAGAAVPPGVGVVLYGLGSEDPGLWRALAGSER
jgi:spore germination protein YaaH